MDGQDPLITASGDHTQSPGANSHPFGKPAVQYSFTAITSALYAITGLVFLDGGLQWLLIGVASVNLIYFPMLLDAAVRLDKAE